MAEKGMPGSYEYDTLYRRLCEAQEWYKREMRDGFASRAADALELQNEIVAEMLRLQNDK